MELPIDQIAVIKGRRRRASPAKVRELAESIQEIGLLNPITVTADKVLVAGLHRLRAFRLLGKETIPATILPVDGLRAELAKIDENLIRSELTVLQRCEALNRRKQIYQMIYPESVRPKGGRPPKNREMISPFSHDSASKIGVTPRTIQQEIQIAINLTEETKDLIREAPLSNRKTDLLWLARMDPEEQKRVAAKIASGKATNVKDARRLVQHEDESAQHPVVLPAGRLQLYLGSADNMYFLADESVEIIITSPPYNLGSHSWDMGGLGARPREDGIGYPDDMPEDEYQAWQLACLHEMYRAGKQGASLFYNHKVRQREGGIIHPLDWLRRPENPWTIRQEIIWDRGSTHNHCPGLFWPQDERVYWLTKGKPFIPEEGINQPSIWSFPGSVANTWHPAPFPPGLPHRCLEAVGRPGIVVLDPFGGSMTTCRVALEMGYDAIGVDVNLAYLERARAENGWQVPIRGQVPRMDTYSVRWTAVGLLYL